MSSPVVPTRIAIIGHQSAGLDAIASSLPTRFSVSVAYADQLHYEFPEFSAVILAFSAVDGAPNSLIDVWDEIANYQIPRAIVITKIDQLDADFDEGVLIARRMFGEGVTPYLVLHADSGEPCALINLEDLTIRDYSSGSLAIRESDDEHKTLVKEFREEFLQEISELEGARFTTGLFVPVIPFSGQLGIGVTEILQYIDEIVE